MIDKDSVYAEWEAMSYPERGMQASVSMLILTEPQKLEENEFEKHFLFLALRRRDLNKEDGEIMNCLHYAARNKRGTSVDKG